MKNKENLVRLQVDLARTRNAFQVALSLSGGRQPEREIELTARAYTAAVREYRCAMFEEGLSSLSKGRKWSTSHHVR